MCVREKGEGAELLEGSEGYGVEFVSVVAAKDVYEILVAEAGRALEDFLAGCRRAERWQAGRQSCQNRPRW